MNPNTGRKWGEGIKMKETLKFRFFCCTLHIWGHNTLNAPFAFTDFTMLLTLTD